MSTSASVSFGVIRSTHFSNSSGSSRAGAGLRITLVLAVLASCAAFKMPSSGVSSCISK
ncbi:Uncharacterised protein [Vibrio cholerae]|nr:Uncharacterised protein [Vibrio cholerae]CSA55948.1 Uncharacterised protein [Vibrio cholerae]